ncbi:MAG: serine protease [Parachlamydiaceae bacterium]|nr:serine protease [Parachlamydiaceae bacterium]
MKFVLTLFFFIFNLTNIVGANDSVSIQLNGYLGKDELIPAKKIIEEIKSRKYPQTLILEIKSNAGDLNQVLELAKSIYELKILNQLNVTAYLNENVLGPPAILPFLADELYSSLSVSWGDVPLGIEGALPANILRNKVRSLIDNKNPKAPVLYVLADAMSDPSLQVIENNGWMISQSAKDTNLKSRISTSGQTLVVNQNQLKELGLLKDVLTLSQFQKQFHLQEQTAEKPSSEKLSLMSSPGTIEDSFKKHIHINNEGTNTIGHIYVGDHESMISESTWLYIKQALEYYKKQRPAFIILELDTPGGEVFAAQKISDALKEMDTQNDVPVVAFINNWAISAGAMLAYSCRYIITSKDGSMGAAEPVYAGEGGKMETASEKVNSALRADFANRARFFDRDPLIAEAMVDKDLILVLRHGKVVKLDKEDQVRTTGPNPDILISPKGKLLTLSAVEMMKYGVADFALSPEKINVITPEEKKLGQWPLEKTPLAQVPYFKAIPNAVVNEYQMDWKTRFFVFLATPMISSLLFMGLIVGAYIEINNPGLSLPGSVAATCLFLIILSSFALEIANWLELILLLSGLALILVELFVLPTFGLLGVLGIVLFIAGLFGMLLPEARAVHFEYDTKTLNAAGQYFVERLAWLAGSLLLSLGIIAILARFVLPSFPGWRRFVLVGNEQDADKGFFAGDDPKTLPQPGTKGEVLATLRPSGKVILNDKIYDAISSGDFIDAGEPIVVVKLDGGVIVVNRLS